MSNVRYRSGPYIHLIRFEAPPAPKSMTKFHSMLPFNTGNHFLATTNIFEDLIAMRKSVIHKHAHKVAYAITGG